MFFLLDSLFFIEKQSGKIAGFQRKNIIEAIDKTRILG